MKRYVRDDGRGIGRAIGEDYVRRREDEGEGESGWAADAE